MTTNQDDLLNMYRQVQLFLAGDGQVFKAVPLIAKLGLELDEVLTPLATETERQEQRTTGLTRNREEVKEEATEKGEVLRQFLLLEASAEVKDMFKKTCARAEQGDEVEFLHYLGHIAEAVAARPEAERTEAGLDPKVLPAVEADVQALKATAGKTRQTQLTVSNATLNIAEIFRQADKKVKKMDGLVKMQKLAQPQLVATYFQARQVVPTKARQRRASFRGTVGFGAPALVYDRRTAGLLTPTLSNQSGAGFDLLYYTSDTATARPQAGQGLRVKHNEQLYQADYAALGPDKDAPYLLVQMLEVGPDGEFVVLG